MKQMKNPKLDLQASVLPGEISNFRYDDIQQDQVLRTSHLQERNQQTKANYSGLNPDQE